MPSLLAVIANVHLMIGSCDVSPWRTAAPRAKAAQASDSATIDIPKEQHGALLGVIGANGAPTVAVHGPGGFSATMPASGPIKSRTVVAFHDPKEKTTFVALKNPRPGSYTVTSTDGSQIVGIRRADILPPPIVSGAVRGNGPRRFLRYRLRLEPGDSVRFFERAPGGTRELGALNGAAFTGVRGAADVAPVSASRARGALSFTPSDASGTKRQIIALVERGGVPVKQVTVARFTAPPPPIGHPRHIRVHRSGSSATITWAGARGARVYIVDVRTNDGRSQELRLSSRSRSVRIALLIPHTRLDVRIVPLRGARRGQAAHAKLRLR